MEIKNLIVILSCFASSASIMAQKNPYIEKVYDFAPAPGQFVNKLPEYEEGDTKTDMIRKAEECIKNENKVPISLGAYGGYVIFGFDHPVANVKGEYDFKIWGNAFASATNPNEEKTRFGGNCEPGIVMVSYDANGNGLPDDEWYELAGSEYNKPETIKNYRLTYHKPDENKVKEPMPGSPYINDITYIKWESNQGDNGYVYRNTFHQQSYYPQWTEGESLTFEGTKLADNYVDESGNGSYYVQYAYDWGYADNFPNADERSGFNIEWAVDASGNPVNLPSIHFVKVYTGVNQYCGWLGETSTEISGAEDLHVNIVTSIDNDSQQSFQLLKNPVTDNLAIISDMQQTINIYSLHGNKEMSFMLESGTNNISCSHLSQGIHIMKSQNKTIKFLKQ
ncbi:T9SS type A sorting domain-containing protein [Dysgonomonas sp. 520]|uniref:T9SS type A sorting domain-containing protein n=1 Tax=Dysgonomonas sp. 520 TaxID=2302931 RepID=UPI0016248C28|nr:T9SS type A sorting domain-containing protein [Dysgonomonas sp. 520]